MKLVRAEPEPEPDAEGDKNTGAIKRDLKKIVSFKKNIRRSRSNLEH